jgi:hypothetical protein
MKLNLSKRKIDHYLGKVYGSEGVGWKGMWNYPWQVKLYEEKQKKQEINGKYSVQLLLFSVNTVTQSTSRNSSGITYIC